MISRSRFIIAAIIACAPLLAQSPAIVRRIHPIIKYQHLIPLGIERKAFGYMLDMGDYSEPLRARLMSLLDAPELVEMKVELLPFFGKDSKLANEVGMQLGSLWAVTDAEGRLVAQGTEVPKAADLRKAMDDAGMKNPIQQLREFLKANPGNLDARLDLLKILLEIAEANTKKALQLEILTPAEARRKAMYGKDTDRTESLIFDLAPLEGKELDSSEDARIWGPYAAELNALFTNGDWRFLKMPTDPKVPLEAASPTMIQLYRRHLPKIESALEEEPSNADLWRVYALAHAVAGRGSVRALVDRLVPAPKQEKFWPDDNVFDLLMSEERAKGNWRYVAQEQWSRWPMLKNRARDEAQRMKGWVSNMSASMREHMIRTVTEPIMRDSLVPLVESLIKTGRIQDAETVLKDMARQPYYRDFQRMAADAAIKCGREDLSQKWLALEIPIKDKADKDDLDLMVKFHGSYMPVLAVANVKQHRAQIEAMLLQGSLSDWDMASIFLDPGLSEIMNRSNGLSDRETNWILVSANGKTIQSGVGLPTPDALTQALIHSATPARIDLMTRFILAHPSHYQAKWSFLYALLSLAEQKTKDKLGKGAGKDKSLLLSEKDDEAIWGEYARVFTQVLSYNLEQSDPDYRIESPTFSTLFIHSPKMRALAAQYLPRVEDALKRQPMSLGWWNQWFYFYPLSEKANFKNLRESLAVPAFTRPLECPPRLPLSNMQDRLSETADWQMIIDVLSWVAEAWRPIFEADPKAMGKYEWENWEPLMTAYLRLDKDSEASALAVLWSASPDWEEIKPNMVNLAKKIGKDELAERWGKM